MCLSILCSCHDLSCACACGCDAPDGRSRLTQRSSDRLVGFDMVLAGMFVAADNAVDKNQCSISPLVKTMLQGARLT